MNRPIPRPVAALLVFFACTTPFGIAAHLISEVAGLGWHDAAAIMFSPRHGYLAALAVASVIALLAVVLAVPKRDRRTWVASLIADLPCGGRGMGFTAVAFATQFAFFAVTQIGEGCPLSGGNILAGAAAAAIASTFGAIAVAAGKRRIVNFALALVQFLAAVFSDEISAAGISRYCVFETNATRRRQPFSFRYRPPPPGRTLRLSA